VLSYSELGIELVACLAEHPKGQPSQRKRGSTSHLPLSWHWFWTGTVVRGCRMRLAPSSWERPIRTADPWVPGRSAAPAPSQRKYRAHHPTSASVFEYVHRWVGCLS